MTDQREVMVIRDEGFFSLKIATVQSSPDQRYAPLDNGTIHNIKNLSMEIRVKIDKKGGTAYFHKEVSRGSFWSRD